jgi:predicted nucleic acid-binding protein
MKRYVLDSFAMIAFYEDAAGADITERILKDITSKKAEGFMSIINWGEIYYSTMREQGVADAERVIKQMTKYPIKLIDADKELTYRAAKLKSQYKIAYADCFAAALCSQLKATLVTGDPGFRKLSNEISIHWIV